MSRQGTVAATSFLHDDDEGRAGSELPHTEPGMLARMRDGPCSVVSSRAHSDFYGSSEDHLRCYEVKDALHNLFRVPRSV